MYCENKARYYKESMTMQYFYKLFFVFSILITRIMLKQRAFFSVENNNSPLYGSDEQVWLSLWVEMTLIQFFSAQSASLRPPGGNAAGTPCPYLCAKKSQSDSWIVEREREAKSENVYLIFKIWFFENYKHTLFAI